MIEIIVFYIKIKFQLIALVAFMDVWCCLSAALRFVL
jgi:hypothetical protein